MNSLSNKVTAHWKTLVNFVLWTLPLGYGIYLISNEAQLRANLTLPSELPRVPMQATPAPHTFNPSAITTVMGLAAPEAQVRSAEPLTLRASFVSNTGLSRALLAGGDGERLYQVGDSLPGASVLRRVELTRVALWRNGREELLPLQSVSARHLLATGPTDTPPAPALLHLQPSADMLKSH